MVITVLAFLKDLCSRTFKCVYYFATHCTNCFSVAIAFMFQTNSLKISVQRIMINLTVSLLSDNRKKVLNYSQLVRSLR